MTTITPALKTFCLTIAASCMLVVNAYAATIYIDFDQPIAMGGPGAPANNYAAAAPSPGAWNAIPATDGVYGSNVVAGALFDINGAPLPGVKVDLGGSMGIMPVVNAPPSLVPHDTLLGDYFDTTLAQGIPWLLQILGIANGTYDVYVYAPSGALTTSAWSFANGPPQQELFGSTDGILNPGLDYDVVQVNVTNNQIVLNSGTVSGVAAPSGLAGIQVVQLSQVPLPGALLLNAGALGLLGWARRHVSKS